MKKDLIILGCVTISFYVLLKGMEKWMIILTEE